MSRLTPRADILRALFARSGNQCAFSGCSQPLVNQKNKFIGQVCHIEAASPGGERFNPSQTDEERRDYNNLLLMCYPHHIETNDENDYTVEKLLKIKTEHEEKFQKSEFKIDESELYKLIHEMESYWRDVERLNKYEHTFDELAFEVDAQATGIKILSDANKAFKMIEDLLDLFRESDHRLPKDFSGLLEKKRIDPNIFSDIPYYENPFENRNWESHNLASRNWMQSLQIALVHIEVKYLEEYLKTNSNDLIAKKRFKQVKEILKELAQNAIHAD